MNPPFTTKQFLGVFDAYNAAIWPLQMVTFGLALVVVAALWRKWPIGNRLIPLILASMWAINAVGYHYLFFSAINPAAVLFAALFLMQAVLFIACAVWQNGLKFEIKRDMRTYAGVAIITYAVLIYPILGIMAGHGLMKGPMLGVAPCPTTIFTIGILLMARGMWLVWLSIIPILWSLIGLAAAIQLGMPEDFGRPLAGGALLTVLIANALRSRRRMIGQLPQSNSQEQKNE